MFMYGMYVHIHYAKPKNEKEKIELRIENKMII